MRGPEPSLSFTFQTLFIDQFGWRTGQGVVRKREKGQTPSQTNWGSNPGAINYYLDQSLP